MQLCTKNKILEYIKDGKISVTRNTNVESLFLDEIRMGLHLREELLDINKLVDLTKPASIHYNKIKLNDNLILTPKKLYIGISQEELSIPNNILGLIYTRSKYARLGLEMVRSSTFVIPGFGNTNPTPITFEISVNTDTTGINTKEKYAFLLFFELPVPIHVKETNYQDRFPLKPSSKIPKL